MQRRWRPALRVVCAVCVLCGIVQSTPARAQQGAPASGEWPTYGGDLGSPAP